MLTSKKNWKLFLYVFFVFIISISIIKSILFMLEGFADYFNENNQKIDILTTEKVEQDQAQEFIKAEDCVLELGGRYGTVSGIINKKLSNTRAHIVVEPDSDVWETLEKNKKNIESQYKIVKGVISNKKMSFQKNGYATSQVADEASTVPHYTFNQIREMVDMPFTALVADCEGCIEHFLNENTEILKTLRIILLEEDMPDKCNYPAVKKLLEEYHFKEVRAGFHSVWIREF